MNLAQRLGEVAQRKADEQADEEEEEDVYEDENEYEEVRMQSRQGIHGGRSRNIGRGNEVKSTRGNVETQDDDNEEDMEEVDENDDEDNEGNTSTLFYKLFYLKSTFFQSN